MRRPNAQEFDLFLLLMGTAALLVGTYFLWGGWATLFVFGLWCIIGVVVNQIVR